MTSPEVCCGFGGTFCVKYPEISNAMVSEKSADIAATGADTLLAGDLGCLMNMAGKLQREGSAVQVRHVAEVLAGMGDKARDRRTGSGQTLMESTAHDFKRQCRRSAGRSQSAGLARQAEGRLLRTPPPGGRAPARVRGAARSRARHQEPRAGQPRFLSRGVRAQGDGAGRPRSLGADRRGRAPHHRRAVPEHGRAHRRQVEIDGGRGDRPQRTSRGARASRRSRPISANTSSSCATSRPATSSRRRCISPRTRSPTPSSSITASWASPSG